MLGGHGEAMQDAGLPRQADWIAVTGLRKASGQNCAKASLGELVHFCTDVNCNGRSESDVEPGAAERQ